MAAPGGLADDWREVHPATSRTGLRRPEGSSTRGMPEASASASWTRPRSAAGNCVTSIRRRSRRSAPPRTEAIVSSGIPASSRRSTRLSLMSTSDVSFAVSSATILSVSLRQLRMVYGSHHYVSKRRTSGHDHAGTAEIRALSAVGGRGSGSGVGVGVGVGVGGILVCDSWRSQLGSGRVATDPRASREAVNSLPDRHAPPRAVLAEPAWERIRLRDVAPTAVAALT